MSTSAQVNLSVSLGLLLLIGLAAYLWKRSREVSGPPGFGFTPGGYSGPSR